MFHEEAVIHCDRIVPGELLPNPAHLPRPVWQSKPFVEHPQGSQVWGLHRQLVVLLVMRSGPIQSKARSGRTLFFRAGR